MKIDASSRAFMPFIQLEQVSKSFLTQAGQFDALKKIEFAIESGEYLAITGKSGSGKSTLLNMLTGIDHPSQGRVLIDSNDIHSMKESKLATWRGKNIGIVFQFFQLIPTLTILENLLLAMDFANTIPLKDRSDRALSLLEQVGILDHAYKFSTALSGGEQQRAAIARALANDPPILVADEPTGNLDTSTAKDIQKIFEAQVEEGKTVIVVTHDQVSNFSFHRVLTMEDGMIVDALTHNKSMEVKV